MNGLDFDFSLKMDFINERELKSLRPSIRELFDTTNLSQTIEPSIQPNPRPDRLEEEEDKKEEEAEGIAEQKKPKKKKTNGMGYIRRCVG